MNNVALVGDGGIPIGKYPDILETELAVEVIRKAPVFDLYSWYLRCCSIMPSLNSKQKLSKRITSFFFINQSCQL